MKFLLLHPAEHFELQYSFKTYGFQHVLPSEDVGINAFEATIYDNESALYRH